MSEKPLIVPARSSSGIFSSQPKPFRFYYREHQQFLNSDEHSSYVRPRRDCRVAKPMHSATCGRGK